MSARLRVGGGVGDGPRQRIVEALAERGYAVESAFFSPALVRSLCREAQLRDSRGEFASAAVGRRHAHHHNGLVRRDRTCWLDGSTLAQCRLLEALDSLRETVNRELFLGLFDYEAHFAIYGQGAFYRRHLDAFSGNNSRVLSTVVYLNPLWSPGDGGALRLWPEPDATRPVLDVAPCSGTLVCFLSERIPHEVLAARRERFSIAGWYRRNNSTSSCIDPSR